MITTRGISVYNLALFAKPHLPSFSCYLYVKSLILFIICLFINNQKEYSLYANVLIIQVRYDTKYYNDVVEYSSSDVTSGALSMSKGQQLFSLLVKLGCTAGCNSGLRWASSLL